jgi:hypothetical protein
MRWISSLRGQNIALTGNCSRTRDELVDIISRAGGRVASGAGVSNTTTLLVRGTSGNWKYANFGVKEATAASYIRRGHALSVVLADDFERLISRKARRIRESPFVAGYRVEDLRAEGLLGQLPEGAQMVPLGSKATRVQLDKLGVGHWRGEQAILRALLLGRRRIVLCSLCGRSVPDFLLVAAHIKPRRRCTMREKRDLRNVAMLVCLLGCDALFERGLIAVDEHGAIVLSAKLRNSRGAKDMISRFRKRRCLAHTQLSEPYFKWHRDHVFA